MNIKLSDLGAAPTSVVGTYQDVQSAGQVGRSAAQLADTVGQLAGAILQKKRQQDEAYIQTRLQDVVKQQAVDADAAYQNMPKDPDSMTKQANDFVTSTETQANSLANLVNEAKGRNLSKEFRAVFDERVNSIGKLATSEALLRSNQYTVEATAKAGQKIFDMSTASGIMPDENQVRAVRQDLSKEQQDVLIAGMKYDTHVAQYTNDITASKEDPQKLVALSADIGSDKTLTANDKAALYNRASSGIKTAYQEAYANATFDVGQLASSLTTSEEKATLANQLRSVAELLPSAKTTEERLAIVKEQIPDVSEGLQQEIAESHPDDVAHWGTSIRVVADALAKAEAKTGAKAPVDGFTDDMFNAFKQDVLSGTRSDQDTLVLGAKGLIGPDGKHYILSEAQQAALAPVFQQAHQNAMFQAYAGRSNKLMKPVLQFLSPDFQKGEYLMDSGRFEQFYNALQTLKASNNVGQATVRNLMGYAIDQMSKGTATDLQGRGFLGIGNGVDPEKSKAVGRALSVIQEKMPHMSDFDVSKNVEQAMNGIDKIWDAGGKDRDKNIDAYIETLKSTTAQQMISGSLQNTINGIPND